MFFTKIAFSWPEMDVRTYDSLPNNIIDTAKFYSFIKQYDRLSFCFVFKGFYPTILVNSFFVNSTCV